MSDTKVKKIRTGEEIEGFDINVNIKVTKLDVSNKEYATKLRELDKQGTGNISIDIMLRELADIIEKE